MSFIPMNYSIEEVLKTVDIPEHILSYIDNLVDEVNKLKQEVHVMDRSAELTYEQSEFRKELIVEIKEILDRNTKFKETKQQIEHAIENSYVEL